MPGNRLLTDFRSAAYRAARVSKRFQFRRKAVPKL